MFFCGFNEDEHNIFQFSPVVGRKSVSESAISIYETMAVNNNDASFEQVCYEPKLKEGWIEKREKHGFTPYFVILKQHHIYFFNGDRKQASATDSRSYLGYIELTQATECYRRASKKSKRKWDFELKIDASKMFVFRLKSEAEMNAWISAVYQALQKEELSVLNAAFQEETAGFLSYRALSDEKGDAQPRRVPQRSHSIPTISLTTDKQRRASDINGMIQEFKEGDNADISYDPVVLYFRWYYPKMTRQASEALLSPESVGTYLLRDNESAQHKDYYTLSYKDVDRIKHHKIEPRQKDGALKFVFYGDERVLFKTPGDAVVFIMDSKKKLFATKPLIVDRSPEPSQPASTALKRTSGDGHESNRKSASSTHDYVEPLSNSDYFRMKSMKDKALMMEFTSFKGEKKTNSNSALPETPFPAPPTQDQLDEGLFGDYANIDALKLQGHSYVNIGRSSPAGCQAPDLKQRNAAVDYVNIK